MMKSRSFQVLITALVALGLHVCCCRVSVFGGGKAIGASGAPTAEETACRHCHHEDGSESSVPAEPSEPHGCCGIHDKPLTAQAVKLEVPLPVYVLVLPIEACAQAVTPCTLATARLTFSEAPPAETSLLRRHCALIV